MTNPEAVAPRTRNAAATRAAILDAARLKFCQDGYDGASLRDIAGEVGVDVALVSRYFGSKEELFNQVLTCEGGPDELFQGERADFGARVAKMLVDDPPDDAGMETLLMILRSASTSKAGEVIRGNCYSNFYGPLEELLGGDDKVLRARLVGALITGFAIMRAIDEDYLLEGADLEELGGRLACMVQGIVDAPCKKG